MTVRNSRCVVAAALRRGAIQRGPQRSEAATRRELPSDAEEQQACCSPRRCVAAQSRVLLNPVRRLQEESCRVTLRNNRRCSRGAESPRDPACASTQ